MSSPKRAVRGAELVSSELQTPGLFSASTPPRRCYFVGASFFELSCRGRQHHRSMKNGDAPLPAEAWAAFCTLQVTFDFTVGETLQTAEPGGQQVSNI